MKRFVLWAIVPALIVLAIAYFVVPLHPRFAPAIQVSLGNSAGGGGMELPAIDGYCSGGGSSSSNGIASFDAQMKYKVVSTAHDHFSVLAHYEIYRNGSAKPLVIDQTLPVFDKSSQALPTQINGDLHASAYLTGTQTGY